MRAWPGLGLGGGCCWRPDLPALPAQVKIAYVNFVNHCYVDTEVEMKEIYTSNHIWTLFENFTLDMARVCACGSVGLSWPVEGDPAAFVVGCEWRGPQALVSPTPGLQ